MRIRSLFLLVLLSAAACGGDDPEPSARTRRPSPSPSPQPVICPLTGVETERSFDISRPTLAVKIENSTKSRPQAGLENADIVYEELAEGGVTRFLALFHCSDADPLGPIRSARLVDPDILREFTPVLFSFSGGPKGAREKVIATQGLTSLLDDNHAEAYRREKGRPAPSNLFSTTQTLRELKDAQGVKGAPKPGWTYQAPAAASTPPPVTPKSSPGASPSPAAAAGTAATTVTFDYSGRANAVKYTHDVASNTYLRFHGETPHTSAAGKQLASTNVVVMKVRITQGTVSDSRGNFSPEIEVVGEGEVLIVHSGKAVTGKWKRPSLAAKTQFVDAAGKPIPLLAGKTWIHLIPQERPITVS